ncbi:MAG: CHASE2 domain-containing protein [Desulfobaccales bacterium]
MGAVIFAAASRRRKAAAGVGIILVAWGLALILTLTGILTPFSLKTLDLLFGVTPLPPASPEVVVVTVAQPDLDFFKERGVSWPWPRQLYAPIVDFCRRGGARAVIFDILYTEASVYGTEDDEKLARALEASGRAVLPFFLSRETKEAAPETEAALAANALAVTGPPPPGLTVYQGVTTPIPPLLQAAAALGNVECKPDPDGIYRRIPLLGVWKGRFLPILALAAFSRLQGKGAWRFAAGALVEKDCRVPIDQEGRALLKFRGPGHSFKRLSAANIIQSEVRLQHGQPPFYQPEDLAGKWVLVGLTAPGLFDLKPTPLAPVYPGVELQATLLDNLLKGDFLQEAPDWLIWLWALVLAGSVTLAVQFFPHLWIILLTVAGLLAVHGGVSLLVFRINWWADPVGPAVSLGFAFALAAAYSYATEGRQKQAIRRMFAQYMSEKVISHLLEHPERLKLGGERRRLTVFFSDLAGFTTLSERLSPEEVVSLLNDYLSRMTDIILAEEGTVDKFEGDAIMAFWGAPLEQEDQALRACRAALEQQAALVELNRRSTERGLPPLTVRIGLHTGEAVVGNLGSQKRFDYTVIGDTVNLASRLEGLNKFYGTFILASETTAAECGDDILFREVDRVAVKGRATPVTVYQPLGCRNNLRPELTALSQKFSLALTAYRQRKFSEAGVLFEQILVQHPDDGPARVFLERCRRFQTAAPPPEWDAVFRPDQK